MKQSDKSEPIWEENIEQEICCHTGNLSVLHDQWKCYSMENGNLYPVALGQVFFDGIQQWLMERIK